MGIMGMQSHGLPGGLIPNYHTPTGTAEDLCRSRWNKLRDGEDPSMSMDEKNRIKKFQRNVEPHELLVGGLQSLGVFESEEVSP